MISRLQGTFLAALALTLSSAFNIETQSPTIFQGEPEAYFGYRVRQFSREGIIVSAPLHREGNRTGTVYQCRYDSKKCDVVRLPVSETGNMHIDGFGISLAVDNRSPPKFTACSPSLSYACGQNTYINCICYEFDSSLGLIRNLTPTFQGCPEVKLDIAILIDGSGSISTEDFKVMKTFMKTVMKNFEGKDVQFSVSQFSDLTRTEFHFNEFVRSTDRNGLIDKIEHMNSVTFTPSGIKHVSEQVFREERGARPDAARFLIVITDGESNDRIITFKEAIAAAERKGILRYAIGVGDAFDTELATKELEVIASKPSSDFVFKVGNFNGLSGLQKKLKEKIFAIEGTGNASSSSSFQLELTQAGFSSVYTSDSLILGAVGAYNWAGAIVQVESTNTSVVRGSPAGEGENAYLGYSAVSVRRPTGSYTVAGAPRYNHIGRVVFFGRDRQTQQWAVRQTIDGEQIGSYFGAELCSVDLEGDGWTDLLLVGAPLYHETDIGGLVSVCPISPQGNVSCPSALRGQAGQTLGRFGSAISALGDLNGDGLTDVAVGAPLEDGHRGSVYIYHGTEGGIAPRYSQRIEAPRTRGDLKYFGFSIDGGADLTQDGLRDLVVGAQGGVMILRSEPVVNLRSTVTVQPAVIPLDMFHCSMFDARRSRSLLLGVCFNMSSPTLSPQIANAVTVFLNYTLSLDEGRPKSRALFPGKGRITERTANLTFGVGFFRHQMDITSCVVDYYRPLDISLSYCVKTLPISQLQGLQPAVREPCVRGVTTQIPFNKNCGPDDVCVADLKLSVNVSGTDTLTVYSAAQCNLILRLENLKEVSFHPVIEILHPHGLSFRKVTVLQADRSVSISCADSVTQQDHSVTNCTIAHQIFAENSHVVFILTLDVSNSETWSHSIYINASASSENEDPATLGDNVVSLDVPVRYRVNLLVKGAESSSYIDLNLGASVSRKVVHRYRVENLSRRPLPVNLTVLVRKDPSGIFLWKIFEAKAEEGLSCIISMEVRGHSGVEGHADEEEYQAGTFQVVFCQIEHLARGLPMTFALHGYISLNSTLEAQAEGSRTRLQSLATLHFDTVRYSQHGAGRGHGLFLRANVSTEIQVVVLVDSTLYIASGGAGGFILLICAAVTCWKMGFFKRTYKDRMNENSPQAGDAKEGTCTEPLNHPPPQNE